MNMAVTVAVSLSIFYCAHSTVSFQCVSFFFAATFAATFPSMMLLICSSHCSLAFYSLLYCVARGKEILLHEKKKNKQKKTGRTANPENYTHTNIIFLFLFFFLQQRTTLFKRCLPVGLAYTSRALAVAG